MDSIYIDYFIENDEKFEKVKELANSVVTENRVYFISVPLLFKKLSEYNLGSGFLILIPGNKITFVRIDDIKFTEYEFNIKSSMIEHLIKHKYLDLFGSPYEFSNSNDYFQEVALSELSELLSNNNNKIDKIIKEECNLKVKKKNNILISLLIGSINPSQGIIDNFDKTDVLTEIKNKILIFDVDQTKFIFPNKPVDEKIIGIHGMAGSGKTELLLHRMANLYTMENASNKIAFTCHNVVLAQKLKEVKIPQFFNVIKIDEQIEWNKRLWCFNSWGKRRDPDSGFYRFVCDKFDIPFLNLNQTTSFANACSKAIIYIEENIADDEVKLFDYTFIDEAQDMVPEFMELCKLVTKEKIYIAGDSFQDIFNVDNKHLENPDYILNKVYRNDVRTSMFAQFNSLGYFDEIQCWLERDQLSLCGYSYEEKGDNIKISSATNNRFAGIVDESELEPYMIYNKKSSEYIEFIKDEVINIFNKHEEAEFGDIAIIILGDSYNNIVDVSYSVREVLALNNVPCKLGVASESVSKDAVYISNQNKVKGLEFSFIYTVVLPSTTFTHSMRNALYMSLTRSIFETNLVYVDFDMTRFEKIEQYARKIRYNNCFEIKEPSLEEKQEIREASSIELKISISVDEKISKIVDKLCEEKYKGSESKKNIVISFIKEGESLNNLTDQEITNKVLKLFEILT